VPTYKFRDEKTKKVWEEWMGIAECDAFLEANKHITQMVHGCPMIVSGVSSKRSKPDDGFRDMLRSIKKSNSRGVSRSTVNTF
jgi:hypothetical protein